MENFYKLYRYTKQYGIRETYGRSKKYLRRRVNASKLSIDVMADVRDVIAADFIANPYRAPKKIKKTKLDIAWVLSPVSPGSGGQNTIVRFARYLKEQGHNVEFYIYEAIHPQSVQAATDILRHSFGFDVVVKKIGDFSDADVVLATGWETAYPVFNLRTNAHKFYFVQDFEPLFYGTGSRSVLAENTYKFNFHGITAGRWLTHRLTTEYGMQCDYFDFGADLSIYRPKQHKPKQKKICFYARPVTERRAFELGVMALTVFHEKHPEYQIEFMGWDVSMYKIDFPYVNRGIISHAELADLYQESVACLVLSLTNVSLLPLELLAAGCIPVMNEGENNEMVLGKNDFIEYSPSVPLELAKRLSALVEQDEAEINANAKAAADSVANASWEKSYNKVEKIIKRVATTNG